MLSEEQKLRVCHSKLITETRALIDVNRNFIDMGLSPHRAACLDEAKCHIISVISGLQYLVEELENL